MDEGTVLLPSGAAISQRTPRHFLGKHNKVIGKGLRLKLIKKQAGNSIWIWPFFVSAEETEKENSKSKGISSEAAREAKSV
ncbi:hypothetical protein NQZ68_032723 [Dissostichus eleginoides]|nr:hypothetical protein NQZ68_032723 [Dissostichus eleginoides]